MSSAAKWHVKMMLYSWCAIHIHASPFTVPVLDVPSTRVCSVVIVVVQGRRVSVCENPIIKSNRTAIFKIN